MDFSFNNVFGIHVCLILLREYFVAQYFWRPCLIYEWAISRVELIKADGYLDTPAMNKCLYMIFRASFGIQWS